MADTTDEAVTLACRESIAEIRFNRPDRLNALDAATAEAFHDCVTRATGDDAVRVIVLTGAGDAFLAGGDLQAMRDAGDDAVATVDAIIRPSHAAMARLMDAPQPVVASLHGAVAGAGMSVALAADLAIAADNTRFNLAYANIGTVPDCSGSWSLPRVVGLRRAMAIALLSETVEAHEALDLGLVNQVVPLAELPAATERLARRLADGPPAAQARIKQLLRASLQHTPGEQLDAEAQAFRECAATEDFHNAVAAFLERRRPTFRGR
ncbi:enoyl-CoA hydratase-related protein [Aquisalimonas lutea]|uniref:enoyl-CoA hydratase/isomerase family protein n=1 Tax=Aquisalimonas lutea TaxID=1327750 RepID=UPI0025B326D8|nr:enoyl-CoA hydratase-related protein [Aquisalimonas lutea]MDN3517624.1 enoyl-CoA hydratase-related protein [Aquisalimonas lutea]